MTEEEAHGHLSEEELKEIADYIRNNLANMRDEVKLVAFLDHPQRCHYCADLKVILDLIEANSSKVKVEYHMIEEELQKTKEYEVEYAPTVILEKEGRRNIRYVGIPGGYEFTVFIETIRNLSNSQTKLSNSTKEKLASINKPVNIKILITLSCPYCPLAARTSNSFAIENGNVRSEIIDVGEIEEVAIKYDVQAVPKIVINESVELLGAQPENRFIQAVLSALN
ncbi:MAG TPA: thioredoxin family protein [Geobacterales bacterium]|nr:thioredoxin family protein [Geobacterales bacterium]